MSKYIAKLAALVAAAVSGTLFGSTLFDGTGTWPTSGDIEIPANTFVTVADANVAAVAGWDTLKLNSGARLTFANGTSAVTFKADCSGSGSLYAANSVGITITGNNRSLAGHWEFTNSAVTVAHEYGLGGSTTGAAVCYFSKTANPLGALDFQWAGQKAFTNHCALTFVAEPSYTGTKAMYLGSLAADEYFVQDANFTMYNPGGSTRALKFRNHTEFISGRFQARYTGNAFWTQADAGAVVRFSGTTKICIGFDTKTDRRLAAWYPLGQSANYYFGHTGGTRMEGFYPNVGNFTLEGDGLFADYVATGESWGMKIWSPYDLNQDSYKSCYDLNGHDVVFQQIRTANNGVTSTSTAYYYVTSAIPATVSLVGDCNGANNASVAALELRGQTSLTIDNNATNRFSTRVSSPAGTLKVKSGVLVYQWNGGWDGTNVVVEGGAIVADSAKAFLNGHSALTMTGGKLCLSAANPVSFATATIGGKTLDPGVYTVSKLRDELALGDYFEGDDSAEVRIIGTSGAWTGWPTEKGATAQVPRDTTVYIHEADVATVAQLGKISLGLNSVVVMDNDTTALSLNCPIAGLGTVRIIDSVGVVLYGDNSKLVSPGCFYIENSAVAVSNRFGLGSANSGAATVVFKSFDRKLTFGLADSSVFTNDVALILNQSGSGALGWIGSSSVEETLVQNASVTFKSFTSYANRLSYGGNLEFAAGTLGISANFFLYGQSYSHLKVGSGCSVSNSAATAYTIALYGAGWNENMQAVPVVEFGPRSVVNVGQISRETIHLKLQTQDMFAASTNFVISYTTAVAEQKGRGCIDLDGIDQTIGRLQASYAPTEGAASFTSVTSTAPATLTLQTTKTDLVRNFVKFEGRPSYCYSGAGTNLFCNMASTADGNFTVTSGVAGFDWSATWAGTNIVVSGTGALYVGASSANKGVFGTASGATKSAAELWVRDSGRLLLEGGTTVVYHATQATNPLARGTYCAKDNATAIAAGATGVKWIEGEGTLQVLKGPRLGFIMFVR